MEKLVEFFTTKKGLIIFMISILGFVFPGMLFVFTFNRELFMEMEIIKLIILSCSISFGLFIVFFLLFCIGNMLKEKCMEEQKNDIIYLLGVPILIENLLIYIGILGKVNGQIRDVKAFVDMIEFVVILFGILLVLYIPCIILKKIVNRIKKWKIQRHK